MTKCALPVTPRLAIEALEGDSESRHWHENLDPNVETVRARRRTSKQLLGEGF